MVDYYLFIPYLWKWPISLSSKSSSSSTFLVVDREWKVWQETNREWESFFENLGRDCPYSMSPTLVDCQQSWAPPPIHYRVICKFLHINIFITANIFVWLARPEARPFSICLPFSFLFFFLCKFFYSISTICSSVNGMIYTGCRLYQTFPVTAAGCLRRTIVQSLPESVHLCHDTRQSNRCCCDDGLGINEKPTRPAQPSAFTWLFWFKRLDNNDSHRQLI